MVASGCLFGKGFQTTQFGSKNKAKTKVNKQAITIDALSTGVFAFWLFFDTKYRNCVFINIQLFGMILRKLFKEYGIDFDT